MKGIFGSGIFLLNITEPNEWSCYIIIIFLVSFYVNIVKNVLYVILIIKYCIIPHLPEF